MSYDANLLGIGSSPYQGDVGYVGIRVPSIPTVDQAHRYFFRLLGIQVMNNRVLIVRGLRQLLTIGAIVKVPDSNCVGVDVELEVTSPAWHFMDGNVSWHLRWENDFQSRLSVFDPNQLPGTSPCMSGLDPALMYNPPLTPYVPIGAGVPPGVSVDALGTWHDMRFPWDETHWELSIPLKGPGTLVFYASVHQTNSATRCPILIPAPAIGGLGALRPEDQFVAAYEQSGQNVTYSRIGGALTVELFPCCA